MVFTVSVPWSTWSLQGFLELPAPYMATWILLSSPWTWKDDNATKIGYYTVVLHFFSKKKELISTDANSHI